MPYKGKYTPSKKYSGDPSCVIYRSLWELCTFQWLDKNPNVASWSSEESVIPYKCPVTGRIRRYYPDLKIKFKSSKIYLVEIKPEKQLFPPKRPTRTTRKYLQEVTTYATNHTKWKYARAYCEDRGYIFEIWTETTLKKLKILPDVKA